MGIRDLKFNEAEFAGRDVTSLPTNPSQEGIGTAELKARFDNIPKMMIALGKHNELIDALAGTEGAGNIGTQGGGNVQAKLDGKFDKVNVTQTLGSATEKVPSEKAVVDALSSAGYGDMLKAAYDKNDNGIVDDAEKLGGQLPAYYAKKTEVNTAQTTANAAIPKAGGSFYGSVTTQNISPSLNNTYVVGGANQRYRDAYFFTLHLDSMLAFEGVGAEWKEIRALTTLAFRKSDAPATKINIDAANCPAPSSARYKENIQNVTEADALKILKLRPVSYNYKPESGYEGSSKAFIAEEAAEVDERYVYRTAHITEPEVSHVDEKTGETIIDEPAVYEMRIEGLNQNPIICDLVALCQRQQRQIDDLTARIENENAALKDLLVKKGACTQEEMDGILREEEEQNEF